MNIQMKRVITLSAVVVGLTIVSNNAFALGRHKHSGFRGLAHSSSGSSNGGSSSVTSDVVFSPEGNGNTIPAPGGNDSNPVPEPTSMLMLGSAIAGFGGYRGLRKRFLNK